VREFFVARAPVDTVLVVNSCARGTATRESDLDVAILVEASMTHAERQTLKAGWRAFAEGHPVVAKLQACGPFARLHVGIFNGEFVPRRWDDGGGPDTFEIEIGNRVAHAVPLESAGPLFRELQAAWLPYYQDDVRAERLQMVREACADDLARVAAYVERRLHFQAFDRLVKALQEFLQALFIARRVYPVAYNKWIREQVVEWLGLPELYCELPAILTVANLESDELAERARRLGVLLDGWAVPRE